MPLPIEEPAEAINITAAHPDTVNEMDASLTDNALIASQTDAIITESPLESTEIRTAELLRSNLNDSKDKLVLLPTKVLI